MFSKPFNLFLVYSLTVANLLIVFLPFSAIFIPVFYMNRTDITQGILDLTYISAFIVSFIMIFYLFMDLLFGFSIWGLTKKCKAAEKYQKKYKFIKQIIVNFKELQQKFASPKAKLLISNSNEVNAYAIGSFRKKIVVITLGLISHIRERCETEEEFQLAVKAIMAHEFSHLVNKDFLPTLLLLASQKATNFVANLLRLFFNLQITLFTRIPILGGLLYVLIINFYYLTNFLVTFFHRFILLKIFNFLKLHFSRATEYRCDREAAYACGGLNTAYALSFLGDNGFVTIFSTHPRTKNRMKKVKDIKEKSGKIRVSALNQLSNFFSISILLIALLIGLNQSSKVNLAQYGFVGQQINEFNMMRKYFNFDLNQEIKNFFNK